MHRGEVLSQLCCLCGLSCTVINNPTSQWPKWPAVVPSCVICSSHMGRGLLLTLSHSGMLTEAPSLELCHGMKKETQGNICQFF